MEQTNVHQDIDNVTTHSIGHNIVLTQDITFAGIMTEKKSPVLKLHY